jgi:hypothetical protein
LWSTGSQGEGGAAGQRRHDCRKGVIRSSATAGRRICLPEGLRLGVGMVAVCGASFIQLPQVTPDLFLKHQVPVRAERGIWRTICQLREKEKLGWLAMLTTNAHRLNL